MKYKRGNDDYKSSLINRLKRQITALKRTLRLKQRCIKYAMEKLDEKGIDYNYSIFRKDKRIVFNIMTGKKSIFVKEEKQISDYQYDIFKNILTNLGKAVNHYNYTKLFYEFSYALYTTSWAAYRILRSVLPFPAESSLRTLFSPTINCIEKRLNYLLN